MISRATIKNGLLTIMWKRSCSKMDSLQSGFRAMIHGHMQTVCTLEGFNASQKLLIACTCNLKAISQLHSCHRKSCHSHCIQCSIEELKTNLWLSHCRYRLYILIANAKSSTHLFILHSRRLHEKLHYSPTILLLLSVYSICMLSLFCQLGTSSHYQGTDMLKQQLQMQMRKVRAVWTYSRFLYLASFVCWAHLRSA